MELDFFKNLLFAQLYCLPILSSLCLKIVALHVPKKPNKNQKTNSQQKWFALSLNGQESQATLKLFCDASSFSAEWLASLLRVKPSRSDKPNRLQKFVLYPGLILKNAAHPKGICSMLNSHVRNLRPISSPSPFTSQLSDLILPLSATEKKIP
ncbi:hypothetical protein KIL84_020783 [Mauremys mutica]|uniref:Uncharacterized protein n=1 Tax=Mauremys mutica TaxID=74926 RepID=A0A9D3X659_9SAUR|nr:hypothetical protein KIL84_020783 [Mauremys mutica]